MPASGKHKADGAELLEDWFLIGTCDNQDGRRSRRAASKVRCVLENAFNYSPDDRKGTTRGRQKLHWRGNVRTGPDPNELSGGMLMVFGPDSD